MPAKPTSIKIFLADGAPDGVRIVTKSNWVGCAVVVSRTQLGDALRRPELSKPGVYVLVGADDDGGFRLYVGEADVLSQRLSQHEGGKDFWTWFVAFSSSDDSLNKANVRYLEARLIDLARTAKQWVLENQSSPAEPPLSEADRADAQWFLDEMLMIFPILGIDAFDVAAAEPMLSNRTETLLLTYGGAKGRGREARDGFVVEKGSRGRAETVPSASARLLELRKQLLERGVMAQEGMELVFLQDFRFTSPSTAADVLVGGSINGRTAWKTRDGRSLKEIQNHRAEQDA